MNTLHRVVIVLLFSLLMPTLAAAGTAVEVRPDSPIIQLPDKGAAAVLIDAGRTLAFADIREMPDRFLSAASLGPPDAHHRYWVTQRILSKLPTDREIRLLPGGGRGWRNVELTVVDDSGHVIAHAGPSGTLQGAHNHVADLNPYLPLADSPRSTLPIFTLRSGQAVTVYMRGEIDVRFPPRHYAASIVDQLRYLEMRRLGLYVEGALAGAMLALAIFGWYSAFRNKDRTSIAYGVWILIALFSSCTQIVHDGQRLYELFFNVENVLVTHLYLSEALTYVLSFGQSMTYVYFARTFLEVRKRFPVFYSITNVYLLFYACYLTVLLFVDMKNINATMFWVPIGLSTFMMLIGIYVCAFIRLREGMEIARFFMVAMVPYLVFRTVFLLNVAGLPSPFQLLPDTGLAFFIKDPSTAQALGVTLEALIMALAVISRTRWLQDKLAAQMQEQNALVENQNRVLEATVAERTRELEAQHRELDETHQIVVGSVNYASRLQRSQLPRKHRIDGRFDSIGVVWEPRDTIGGDLWWISSSQVDGPFTVAVADCTGHGVPGAMLSLLVSNSLERIYSGNPHEDPARALASLDYLVRSGLNQDAIDTESDDGCDAALLCIDRAQNEIRFAGAKIGVFQLKATGEVRRHHASRTSLGYRDPIAEEDEPFTQRIHCDDGDAFVIVTDGFTDQLGGPSATPVSFGYRRLEALLASMPSAPASEIADAMRAALLQWQGSRKRRDDVTAVVFRLGAPSVAART
jgi:serine phosphatase RsbU (regulator of sigma subunit)